VSFKLSKTRKKRKKSMKQIKMEAEFWKKQDRIFREIERNEELKN
tara:strand:+ start:184 stop:318 length:135 start_codon:yes stop_codon:yes gene_type:complete